jgi:hypothetical protein
VFSLTCYVQFEDFLQAIESPENQKVIEEFAEIRDREHTFSACSNDFYRAPELRCFSAIVTGDKYVQ